MDTTISTRKTHYPVHEKSHDAIDKTAAGAQKAVDRIAEAAAPAIERMAAGAHRTVDILVDAAAPVAERIESGALKLNKSGHKAMESGKKFVRDHPLATIGAALAIGALISLLARGRPD